MQTCLSSEVPHQVAGGEESVPAVQHASAAAGPAGRQHRGRRAHTAAPAWHREPGVATWSCSRTSLHPHSP